MVLFGLIKDKRRMLLTQIVQFFMQSLGNLVLGSITGFFSCIVSVFRIFIFMKLRVTVWLKLAFIVLQAGISLAVGAETIFEWLPFFSMVAYTWYLDTEDPITFKIVNLIGVIMWTFHDFHYVNYAAFSFDILTIVSTLAGIYILLHEKKRKGANDIECEAD